MTETSSISKSTSSLRDLKYGPFLILLTLGLFVRLALMFLYYPAVMLSAIRRAMPASGRKNFSATLGCRPVIRSCCTSCTE